MGLSNYNSFVPPSEAQAGYASQSGGMQQYSGTDAFDLGAYSNFSQAEGHAIKPEDGMDLEFDEFDEPTYQKLSDLWDEVTAK